MKCEWDKLLAILPPHLRSQVEQEGLQEIRLRPGKQAQLVTSSGERFLKTQVTTNDLHIVINSASKYSPWAASGIAQGYITAPGGHRIGICGEVVMKDGSVTGIRNPTSLCVRVARQISGIADGLKIGRGNLLIAGPPGSGKTTLLRELIRKISDQGRGCVGVVDERGELFPVDSGFVQGQRTDVLTGCGKKEGIDMLLKTMGPACIAVDEITSESDCKALGQAVWCGVQLLATVHAESKRDLLERPVYRSLVDCGHFDRLIVLGRDKSRIEERMRL